MLWKIWILAARPKTLILSLMNVLVGSTLARTSGVSVDWTIAGLASLVAILIQAGINYFNDAIDYQKGADTSERLGPARATQMGWMTAEEMLRGGFVVYAIAALLSIPLLLKGGWVLIPILLGCLLFGYLYTGGPFPLAYHGLGDLFVFLFFGWIIVGTSYYLQTGFVDLKVLLAGTQVGLLSVTLLAINNVRDINQDRKVSKKTLPVRFGELWGKGEISFCLFVPLILNLFWSKWELGMLVFLPFAMSPLATAIHMGVWRNFPGKIFNGFLGLAALYHLGFCLLMIVAIYL